jgi:Fur family transcriptional regulator, stress-responsive regulator
VVEALGGEHVHLTVEQILAAARRHQPALSQATAYNTLNDLVALGEVTQVRVADGNVRFDPKVGPNHHHLVCDDCGLIYDVDPRGVEGLFLPRAQRYGMTIDSVEVVFHGRCSACAEGG